MITTARTDVEASHLIGGELAEGLDPNVKLVGSGVGKTADDVVNECYGRGCIGLIVVFALGGLSFALSGADALAGLDKMAVDCLSARGAVF